MDGAKALVRDPKRAMTATREMQFFMVEGVLVMFESRRDDSVDAIDVGLLVEEDWILATMGE